MLRGHTDVIQDLAFGPDGKVVTASCDGTAKIWDLESRRELATLRGHTGPVLGVAVSPDGALVATGSLDGTAKLWDPATGREMLTLFGHDLVVNTVTFSPDGRFLATGSGDGTVALHLLPIDELRDFARERVTRTLHGRGVSAVPTRGEVPGSNLDRWSVPTGRLCLPSGVLVADGGRCRGLLTLKGTQTANSAGEASKEKKRLARVPRAPSGSVRMPRVWPQFGHNRARTETYVGGRRRTTDGS